MLIHPGEHQYRALPWVPQREWRASSQAQPKDQFGCESRTRFRLTARLRDGHVRWRGWFDSREDADAFLWSLARHLALSEPMPRELWDLPTPSWHDIAPFAQYDFATWTALRTPTGSNQTYTSPTDWNNADNIVYTIGGGATGAAGSTAQHYTGGGGGACNWLVNYAFATPGTSTATYRIAAALARTVSTTAANGTAGNQSWFGGTTFAGASVAAAGGSAGVFGIGSQSGGVGGLGSAGAGTDSRNGGSGGNLTGASGSGASGAGGAGSPTGNGSSGVSSSSTSLSVVTNGGKGGGADGGAAGTDGDDGSPGANFDEVATETGSGGGGGAFGAFSTAPSGDGGNYGGAGAAKYRDTPGASASSGTAAQGVIVIVYTPPVLAPNGSFFSLLI